MAASKEDQKRLKAVQKEWIAIIAPRTSGYENLTDLYGSVTLYRIGISIGSGFSIKGFIPIESILKAEICNDPASSCCIEVQTTMPSAALVRFSFREAKQAETAIDFLTKLNEIIGQPLSSAEIQNKRVDLSRNLLNYTEKENKERTDRITAQQVERPETRKEKIKRLQAEDKVYCPKCLSTQITAHKKGFSVGQAITFGTLAGMIGSNKIEITCLSCGNKFKPGKK